MTRLTKDLKNYHFVAQSELTIDGVDDKDEMKLTSVRILQFQIFANYNKSNF